MIGIWRCRVCEGVNQGGRVCATCGTEVPHGEPLRAAAVLGLLISAVAVVLLRNAAARRGVARGPDALAAAPAGADAVTDR